MAKKVATFSYGLVRVPHPADFERMVTQLPGHVQSAVRHQANPWSVVVGTNAPDSALTTERFGNDPIMARGKIFDAIKEEQPDFDIDLATSGVTVAMKTIKLHRRPHVTNLDAIYSGTEGLVDEMVGCNTFAFPDPAVVRTFQQIRVVEHRLPTLRINMAEFPSAFEPLDPVDLGGAPLRLSPLAVVVRPVVS